MEWHTGRPRAPVRPRAGFLVRAVPECQPGIQQEPVIGGLRGGRTVFGITGLGRAMPGIGQEPVTSRRYVSTGAIMDPRIVRIPVRTPQFPIRNETCIIRLRLYNSSIKIHLSADRVAGS